MASLKDGDLGRIHGKCSVPQAGAEICLEQPIFNRKNPNPHAGELLKTPPILFLVPFPVLGWPQASCHNEGVQWWLCPTVPMCCVCAGTACHRHLGHPGAQRLCGHAACLAQQDREAQWSGVEVCWVSLSAGFGPDDPSAKEHAAAQPSVNQERFISTGASLEAPCPT